MNKITTRTLPGFLNERGIGFDRMFDMIDEAVGYAGTQTYPPYNLYSTSEDDFVVEVAVAGFTMDDLEITQDGNKLTLAGNQALEDGVTPTYIHKGISARSFKRDFVLAEHVTVEGAELKNGILSVSLRRELPEAMKPRTIDIKLIK